MMDVTVRYQGIIGDMLGRKSEQISLTNGATIADLITILTADDETATSILKQTRPFMNGRQADRLAPLAEGAEVLFMRPIAGG